MRFTNKDLIDGWKDNLSCWHHIQRMIYSKWLSVFTRLVLTIRMFLVQGGLANVILKIY
jgi:hypothetical protein